MTPDESKEKNQNLALIKKTIEVFSYGFSEHRCLTSPIACESGFPESP